MPLSGPQWKVSLHGGHSREFCDHAHSSLRDILQAAVRAGYHTFGVTEHAPRVQERFLYPNELAMGWDVAKICADFENYAHTLPLLIEEFSDRLNVLKGFEIEVVPSDSYIGLMQQYRQQYGFEYVVGSVHYVHEISIDGSEEQFLQALETCGGLENLALRYYQAVAEMVMALQPEVVAHFDLIKLYGRQFGSLETPRIRQAVEQALEVVRLIGGILEVNTAGYRKGLGEPYPAPWIVQLALRIGVPFCFSDDSHHIDHVGFGIEAARNYLIGLGVKEIVYLWRQQDALVKKRAPLF